MEFRMHSQSPKLRLPFRPKLSLRPRNMEESMEEKSMASEISVEENPFNRLPEELIVFIFGKISDAKCLCICFSVSKSFAALVLQTRVVSVKMPGGIAVCSCHSDPSAGAGPPVLQHSGLAFSLSRYVPRFLDRPFRVLFSLLNIFRRRDKTDLSNVWPRRLGIMNFLKKFSCVDSITVHFSFGDPDGTNSQPRFEPLLRWKSGLSGFIFVSARNCVALTDEYTDSSVQIENDLTMEEIVIPVILMRRHFIDSILRVAHIRDIVAVLPNVKYVATVDDMKQGIVALDEEEIAVMKEENPMKASDKVWLKVWTAPVMKLPLSGCIMEEVSLILVRPIEGYDALVAENSFEEEEYRELAAILVKEEASFEKIVSISNVLGH